MRTRLGRLLLPRYEIRKQDSNCDKLPYDNFHIYLYIIHRCNLCIIHARLSLYISDHHPSQRRLHECPCLESVPNQFQSVPALLACPNEKLRKIFNTYDLGVRHVSLGSLSVRQVSKTSTLLPTKCPCYSAVIQFQHHEYQAIPSSRHQNHTSNRSYQLITPWCNFSLKIESKSGCIKLGNIWNHITKEPNINKHGHFYVQVVKERK